jgi:hypothetical protein
MNTQLMRHSLPRTTDSTTLWLLNAWV